MPDNEIALGIRPATPPDIIGPISSLAQLQYLQANAARANADVGQIGLANQFTQGKLDAINRYTGLVSGGMSGPDALNQSGLSVYDPAGANATLANYTGARNYKAIGNYDPSNPYSLAGGGPALVGEGQAAAEKANAITTQRAQLFGQLGTMMANDPSPQGRAQAATFARSIPLGPGETPASREQMITQYMNAPDQNYVLAGKHFQQASMTPEKYMDVSGQAALAQGQAKAATDIRTVGPTDTVVAGPAAFNGNPFAAGAGAAQPVTPSLPAPTANPPSQGLSAAAAPNAPAAMRTLAPAPVASPAALPPSAAAFAPTGPSLAQPSAPAAPAAASAPVPPAKSPFGVSGPALKSPATAAIPQNGSAVYNGLIARGLDPLHAAVIAGNIQQESGFRSNAINGKEGALGFLQWEGPRRVALENYAAQRGTSPTDPNTQLDFIVHEFGGSESGAAKAFLAANNLTDANAALKGYIRYGDNSEASRLGFANRFAGGSGYVVAPGAAFAPSASQPFASPLPAVGAPSPFGALTNPFQPQKTAQNPTPQNSSNGVTPIAPVKPIPVSAPAGPAPGSVPVTPAAPAQPLASTAPGGLNVVAQGMGPAALKMQEGIGAAQAKQYEAAKDGFQQASAGQSSLHQLMGDLDNLKDGGFLSPGTHADERLDWARAINTALTAAGMQPYFDPKVVGSAESADKISGRLGFDLARTMGSREAAQIITKSIQLNPGMKNTPQGARMMAATIDSTLQRSRDFYQFLAAHKNDPDADLAFNQQHPPAQYVQEAQRLANIPMPYIQRMEELATHPNAAAAAAAFDQRFGPGMSRYFSGQ